MKDQRGYSLIEMMIVICLVTTITLIGCHYLTINKTHTLQQDVESTRALLDKARHSALSYHQHVVICPLNSKRQCQSQHGQGLLAFIDNNQNQQLDPQEHIIDSIRFRTKNIDIQQHTFSAQQHLQFSPQIKQGHTNGHLLLSAPDQAHYKITISRHGRIKPLKLSRGQP